MAMCDRTITDASTTAEIGSPGLLLRVLTVPMVRTVIMVPAGIVTAADALGGTTADVTGGTTADVAGGTTVEAAGVAAGGAAAGRAGAFAGAFSGSGGSGTKST